MMRIPAIAPEYVRNGFSVTASESHYDTFFVCDADSLNPEHDTASEGCFEGSATEEQVRRFIEESPRVWIALHNLFTAIANGALEGCDFTPDILAAQGAAFEALKDAIGGPVT